MTERIDPTSGADVAVGVEPSQPGQRPPTLPWVALALGVLALLLAILPWTGVVAALVALVVSVVAWRRCARRADVGLGPARGVGVSQVATGLALSVLAISLVWSVVATVVPKQSPPPSVDCSDPDLGTADRFQCGQLPQEGP